jgi:hypothetical protein
VERYSSISQVALNACGRPKVFPVDFVKDLYVRVDLKFVENSQYEKRWDTMRLESLK